jgi:hypothetical protein
MRSYLKVWLGLPPLPVHSSVWFRALVSPDGEVELNVAL